MITSTPGMKLYGNVLAIHRWPGEFIIPVLLAVQAVAVAIY
jgi:hypothetical protein